LAERLGFLKIIEKAGGTVTTDICTIVGCPEALGFKSVTTNSSKMAFYSPGSNRLGTWFGSTRQCIDAAIKGKWEA
jgi:predicted aconitase